MEHSPQVQYVCTELVNNHGVMFCKKWAVLQNHTWVDALAITPKEMALIGGSIISTLAIILAFTIIAKASKTL